MTTAPGTPPHQASDIGFVDTHAHLDEPAFDPDRDAVIAAAVAAGVTRIINVGYRPARWATSTALAGRHPTVFHMLGLHPHHADQFTDETCAALAERVCGSEPVAIGEIGLDYYRDGPPPEAQRRAFEAQLGLASELRLPVVIHQRAAEDDLMSVLGRFPDAERVILHSFDGTERLASFALDRGYYFGVGGLFTRPANHALRAVIASLPLDRVLLETDAPYLVPTGVEDRRNVPANIPRIADALGTLLRSARHDIARQTTANAAVAFGLPREPAP